jgi:V/A-type H+-transporting ATPase subunit F
MENDTIFLTNALILCYFWSECKKLSYKQKTDTGGLIAVMGERELVIGYRLLGIDNTVLVDPAIDREQIYKTIESLFSSKKYSLIIASQFIHNSLPPLFKAKVESSIDPLVLFLPSLKGNIDEESLSSLAKRVLGISIGMSQDRKGGGQAG